MTLDERIRTALATEAEQLPGPDTSVRPRSAIPRRLPGWIAAAVAAVVVFVVLGAGSLLLRDSDNAAPGTPDDVTTTIPAPVARITVFFRPRDPTPAEWDDFAAVLRIHPSATGYIPVDEETARRRARAYVADDPFAATAVEEHPDIVTGFAHVDFASRDDASRFQEEVTTLEFVIAAIGANGPRLGAGYDDGPVLDLDEDDVRASLWQVFFGGDPGADPVVTTTQIG